ncbi:MAG: Crp/Fnr family transcriptional regulator [Hyphomicrobium sp.]
MLSKAEAGDLLAKAPLFGSLDEASRSAVVLEMREATYDVGQTIFSRGDAGGDLHLLARGRVKISVLTSDGRELSFAHAEPPAVFGELALFDGLPRSADATAVNRVVTLMLSKASLSRLLTQHAPVAEAALKYLSGKLRQADEQLEAIALHPIEARLARFFLTAARQKDPSGKSGKVTLALPISQSELALLIGASRPKVNAALSMLEAEGAIERRGQQVICDVEVLSGLGGLD